MTEPDADRVGEVGFAAWAANPVLNDCGADMSQRVHSAFRDFAVTGSKVILVAESNGEIVGWGARENAPNYISDLWVSPAHQRKGIGGALIGHLCDLIAAGGHRTARLDTHARDDRAIRLYERAGFIIIWRGTEFSKSMGFHCEKVHLEKPLACV